MLPEGVPLALSLSFWGHQGLSLCNKMPRAYGPKELDPLLKKANSKLRVNYSKNRKLFLCVLHNANAGRALLLTLYPKVTVRVPMVSGKLTVDPSKPP
jgi:hypothetical protein